VCVAGALRARCSPSSPLSHLPAAPSQERAALESGSDEEGEEKESPLLKKAKKAGAKTISCLLGCGANFRSDEKAKAHETECFKRQQGLKAREQNLAKLGGGSAGGGVGALAEAAVRGRGAYMLHAWPWCARARRTGTMAYRSRIKSVDKIIDRAIYIYEYEL